MVSPTAAAASPSPTVHYYLVHALGYIGRCAGCQQDIAGEIEDDWKIRFILACGPDSRHRFHPACRPGPLRFSRPSRPVAYWDWQERDYPATLPPI